MDISTAADEPLAPALLKYLAGPGPHCLEIGAGTNGRPGWLATDLIAQPEDGFMQLDATAPFNIPTGVFDFVYSEHMIEHVAFEDGLNMLEECHRILKPGGAVRIVTPSLGFLLRIMSADRGPLEEGYRQWSVTAHVPEAPTATNAFFLNNFMRAWGHRFIYDRETLAMALTMAGFEQLMACELNRSIHPRLCGLENEQRMPPGYLALESMVLEGRKLRDRSYERWPPAPKGRNIALGQPATQSSLSSWSLEKTVEEEAARLVSGQPGDEYNCHTGLDSPPWWQVDLGQIRRIDEVRIYNRLATPEIMARANRLEIQLSDDGGTWVTVFRKETDAPLRGRRRGSPFIWAAGQPPSARHLRIRLLGTQYLHLRQVEIYGE